MSRGKRSLGSVGGTLIILVTTIGAGCKPAFTPSTAAAANNLKYVKCQSKNGGNTDVAIEVQANGSVLMHPEDRVVFVCKDETVRWFTNSPGATIEVDFKYKTNAANLFTSGLTDLKSTPASANQPTQTTPQTVKDPGTTDFAHSYTLIVVQGTNQYRLDPHVIPMGN